MPTKNRVGFSLRWPSLPTDEEWLVGYWLLLQLFLKLMVWLGGAVPGQWRKKEGMGGGGEGERERSGGGPNGHLCIS